MFESANIQDHKQKVLEFINSPIAIGGVRTNRSRPFSPTQM